MDRSTHAPVLVTVALAVAALALVAGCRQRPLVWPSEVSALPALPAPLSLPLLLPLRQQLRLPLRLQAGSPSVPAAQTPLPSSGGAGGPLAPASAQDRGAVAAVVNSGRPAAEITGRLVEMTGEQGPWVPQLAAAELAKRTLSEQNLQRLLTLAHDIPFRSFSDCVVAGGDPKYANRTGRYAWEAAATAIDRRPQAERLAWLIGELRYSRLYAASPADSASRRLEELGEPAVPALIAELQRHDPGSEHMAARTLRSIGSPAAKAALEQWALAAVANSSNPLVWPSAARWLAELHSARAYPVVEQALWRHLDEYGARNLIRALVTLDRERARQPLVRLLTQCRPDAAHPWRIDVYLDALSELVTLGDPAALEAVQAAADSPLPQVRRGACMAAYHLGKQGRPLLEKLSRDPDERVADLARSWLRNWNPPPPFLAPPYVPPLPRP